MTYTIRDRLFFGFLSLIMILSIVSLMIPPSTILTTIIYFIYGTVGIGIVWTLYHFLKIAITGKD